MKSQPITQFFPNASSIAFGCMGLGGGWNKGSIDAGDVLQAHQAIDTALDVGINFFDHADIYSLGKAEQAFGKVLNQRPELRQEMILQSKCAIRFADDNAPTRYDHSQSWINQSVDSILQRLHIEQLDILLLHRPDPLMDVEELAETLVTLKQSGKVKHFGVSNMHRYQMELINAHLSEPLIVNQLEMSLSKHGFVEQAITVAMDESAGVGFDTGTLEYCQLNNVQLQSWGSLSQGLYSGNRQLKGNSAAMATSELVTHLANKYQVAKETIVLAWLMKLPVAIQPVIGTINEIRIQACAAASRFSQVLSREDWYRLYTSARGKPLP